MGPYWFARKLTPGAHALMITALAVGLAFNLRPASAVQAATFTVTKTADTNDDVCDVNDCSLREAIIAANTAPGPDTILVPSGIYTLTISGTNEDLAATGDLDIYDSLTITGGGAASTVIDGNSLDRVFQATSTLTVSGVTVQNGLTPGNGGGLDNESAVAILTLVDSIVTRNTANTGAGLYNFGGTLILSNTILISNTTTLGNGGGLRNSNSGAVTLLNSTVSGNSASNGGGIYNNSGTVILTNSTLGPSNSSTNNGGGFYNDGSSATVTALISNSLIRGNSTGSGGGGGGIYSTGVGATLTLTNTSLTSNSTGSGGGGGVRNLNSSAATLTNATLTSNTTTGSGGGIRNSANATLKNTLLASNSTNCGGSVTSAGHNLDSGASCGLSVTGDITNTNPLLGALQDNGGPTLTQAPAPASPAIDAGNNTGCPATDQRGFARPIDGNADATATCDIGAYEFTPTDLVISKTDDQSTAVSGAAITYTLLFTITGPSLVSDAAVTDIFSAAITNVSWTCAALGGSCGSSDGSGNISTTVSLPVDGTATFIALGNIASTASGTLTNTASVVAPLGVFETDASDNSATDSTTLTQAADLAISKTDGQASTAPGSPITYTIVVGNSAGPSAVTGATVTDTFPAAISNVSWTCSASGGSSCGSAGSSGNLSTTVDLAVGGTATFIASGTIAGNATGALTNTAYVATPGGVTESNPNDNSATDTTSLSQATDLSIGLTDGQANVVPGAAITYTIVVTNNGVTSVTGAIVTDTFPAAVSGVAWTCLASGGSCGAPSGTGSISATINLSAGGTATFLATGTVASSATGSLSNTAYVAAPPGVTDTNPNNNSATDTSTLTPMADLSMSKTDGQASATPGTAIVYTLAVTNHGLSDVSGAAVADTVPATITGVAWTCTPSAGSSCAASGSGNSLSGTANLLSGGTATYTITGLISTSATGTLSNTAIVTAPAGVVDPTPGNNSATDETSLTPAGFKLYLPIILR